MKRVNKRDKGMYVWRMKTIKLCLKKIDNLINAEQDWIEDVTKDIPFDGDSWDVRFMAQKFKELNSAVSDHEEAVNEVIFGEKND